jgi:hypothetical protein
MFQTTNQFVILGLFMSVHDNHQCLATSQFVSLLTQA